MHHCHVSNRLYRDVPPEKMSNRWTNWSTEQMKWSTLFVWIIQNQVCCLRMHFTGINSLWTELRMSPWSRLISDESVPIRCFEKYSTLLKHRCDEPFRNQLRLAKALVSTGNRLNSVCKYVYVMYSFIHLIERRKSPYQKRTGWKCIIIIHACIRGLIIYLDSINLHSAFQDFKVCTKKLLKEYCGMETVEYVEKSIFHPMNTLEEEQHCLSNATTRLSESVSLINA